MADFVRGGRQVNRVPRAARPLTFGVTPGDNLEIVSKEIPTRLYKYLPTNRAFQVLQNLMIRFSQPSVLNDPSELQPSSFGTIPKEEIERTVAEGFESEMSDELTHGLQSLPPHVAELVRRQAIKFGVLGFQASLSLCVNVFLAEIDRKVGILSLSETPLDKILWAQYADGERGFLLEFDPNNPWFWAKRGPDDDLRELRRVFYSGNRTSKYLPEATGDDVFYTKDQEWSHEKEWRMIRSFDEAATSVSQDAYGKEIFLFAIPPACIVAVVAGYRATPEAIDRIRGILNANGALAHVRFDKSVRMTTGAIEIVPG